MGRGDSKKKSRRGEAVAVEGRDRIFSDEVAVVKRSGNLNVIFDLFSMLEPFHKKKKLKRKKTTAETEFLYNVESILKLFLVYQRNRGGCISWAKLIYDYMTETSAENSFQDFLTPDKRLHIETILQDYVTISMPIESDNLLLQSLIEMTEGLLTFLRQHHSDPYSCLIGQVASKDIIENTKSDKEIGKVSEEGEQKGSRADILQKIMSWAVIDDAEELQRNVREFAGQLRGVQKLAPGSLVLVEISKERFIYGRYPGGTFEGKMVEVIVNPTESETKSQRLDAIYPLKPSVVKRIQERSPKELEKMVQLPTNTLYQSIMALVETKTHGYFENAISIDMDVIRKANMNQCSISELQKLTEAQMKLRNLQKNPPEDLFASVDTMLQQKIKEFISTGGNENLFKPTAVQNLKQLREFQLSRLVMMHIQRYIGICESGLDQLKLQKRELMSGERKDKISEWWLHEIDREVLNYLEGKGYIYDAVPENYVEQPPEDMNAVQENVSILSPLLDPNNESLGIKEVIQRLQDRIYPKIEDFIDDAKIVLSEQFNMDLTGKDFSLPQVEAAFEKEKESIDPQIREWIDDMIKDIHYLNEMHKLEDPEYAKGLGNEVSLHIVPISGLVVGMLCRLENECKTVVELWEPVDYQDSEDRTILHEAIAEGAMESIFEILKNSPEEINVQDANGFSPLHIAASTYTETHLEIFERILGLQGVNVNLKNVHGSTALYYLVRHPTEQNEKVKDLVLRVIRKMTQLGCNVNAKNNAGETCLHAACVLDNPEVVKLLIACGANAKEPNFEGETCVYTAVRAGNIRVVKSLLDFGVDMSVTANGKTPLDIARQLNDIPLVRLLSGERVDVIEKTGRRKYKKSDKGKDSFWNEETNRVSMKFSMGDLEELERSETEDPEKKPAEEQQKEEKSEQKTVFVQKSPRRSTAASKLKQMPSSRTLFKANTESVITEPVQRRASFHTDWTSTDKKLPSLKKRTQISLGSNRDSH